MGYYIGIDLGTSAVKMLLMDANGDIIKSITKEYPIYFPQNGWSEQDPQDWWNAVKAGIQEITAFVMEIEYQRYIIWRDRCMDWLCSMKTTK